MRMKHFNKFGTQVLKFNKLEFQPIQTQFSWVKSNMDKKKKEGGTRV